MKMEDDMSVPVNLRGCEQANLPVSMKLNNSIHEQKVTWALQREQQPAN